MPTVAVSDPFLQPFDRQIAWAGGLLGFALGGFFDGILLHQILQWHHLLSAVENPALTDIRVLILSDGLFHALMYVVALAGLGRLWRSRRAFAVSGAGRPLLGAALIGFGVWHMLDGVLSHWILGIHRVRMDVENRLFWDLLWFVVFGVVFAMAGWWLRRSGKGGGPGGPRRMAPTLLALAVLVAGPVAALPPSAGAMAMVLFEPGVTPSAVAAAVAAVDGRLVWSDPSGQLWAIDLGPGKGALPLYRHGAILVSNAGVPAGCLDWFRMRPAAG
ncbi:DUF2243 domain-containing protein [Azospirillum doebereinerae]